MSDQKTILICPGCQASFSARQFDSARKYACKKCGGNLEAKDEARTVTVTPRPPEIDKLALNPKNVFGKYVLMKKIGAGGMGEVYKAWDTHLERFVAIKTLLGAQEEDVLRFQREAQTAAQLRHPNIVEVYEVNTINDRHVIAMEHVEGKPLNKLKLPVKRSVEIARDISVAVHEAHRHGIMHRDIKPSNIMIDPDGEVHVMDFGLAKSIESSSQITLSGVVMGTPSYMSPEQARDDKKLDHRTDIYSIGALLYHCLTGRPPFDEADPVATLEKVVYEDPVPPSQRKRTLPKTLDTIILKCLEKDPARRYTDGEALAADLNRWLQGDQISARRTGVASRIGRKLKRRLQVVIAGGVAAAVVLITVIALVVSAMGSSRQHEEEVRSLLQQADRLFLDKKWEEAKLAYDRVLGLEPGHPHALAKSTTAGNKLEEQRTYDDIKKRENEAKRIREEAERRKKEEADRKRDEAKRKAQPEFDQGKSELEEANRDLYRSGVDLTRMNERLRKAVLHFTRALNLFPDYQEAWLLRGQARKELELFDDAEEDFGRAVELSPTSAASWLARGRLFLARLQGLFSRIGTKTKEDLVRIDGWRAKAGENLAKAKSLGVQEEDAIFVNALLAYVYGKTRQAIGLCEDLIRKRDSNEEAWKLKGDCLHTEKRYADALEAYTKAIQLRANYYTAYGRRGEVLFRMNRFGESIEDISTALEINPAYVDGWVNRGTIQYQIGRVSDGAHDFKKALELDPDNAVLLTNMGILALQEGRLDDAMRRLGRAIGASPTYSPAFMYRSMVYKRRGELQKAVEDANESVKFGGNTDFMVWFNRAGLLYEFKYYAKAIPDYTAALRLKPDLPDAWYLRAECLVLTKKPKEAEEDYTRYIRLRPNNTEGYHGRANARFDGGNPRGAIQDYTRALEINPGLVKAQYDRAGCWFNLREYAKAADDYAAVAKANEQYAQFAGLWRYRAEALFKLKKYKECIEDCDKALKLGSKDTRQLNFMKTESRRALGE